MIEWRKWKSPGECETDKLYLVMRRSSAFPVVAVYRNESGQGTLFFALGGYALMDVRHYAVINRPGEEEA